MKIKTTCKYCVKEFSGRSDKKFCSTTCKNKFNYKQRKETKDITKTIDNILHRNRIILKILVGERRKRMKIDRLELDRMGFNFNYITGVYKNSRNKTYHYIYDYAWMEFSTQEILVVRK